MQPIPPSGIVLGADVLYARIPVQTHAVVDANPLLASNGDNVMNSIAFLGINFQPVQVLGFCPLSDPSSSTSPYTASNFSIFTNYLHILF